MNRIDLKKCLYIYIPIKVQCTRSYQRSEMFFLVSGKVKSEMIFFSILEVVSASYSVSPAVPFLGDLTMYYRTERSTALEVSDIIESMSTQ